MSALGATTYRKSYTAGRRIDLTNNVITSLPFPNTIGQISGNLSFAESLNNNGSVYGVRTDLGAYTINLPDTPSEGYSQTIYDRAGNAAANNITVAVTGGGTINGAANDVINSNYGSRTYVFNQAQYIIINSA